MQCMRCKAPLERSYRACPQCGEPVTEFARRYTDELLDGKYRIIERLGAGGMGEVYRAEHTYLGSMRVIKVIRPQISDNQDVHDRFLREARASTKVQHPNVATLHDFSALPDGAHYMVWEYIDGENLAQRIRARGTLPPRTAIHIAVQALHGLEAIHRAGIVHRDISPENLMITADDTVKIIDLGVAKVEDPSEVSSTKTGIFIGKLRYASPEHLGFLNEGERIDGRADLYSLAMVLYEMLTGRPPFEATSPHEYYMLHARQEFRAPELPASLPGGSSLQGVLQRALARDRQERYPTARDFALALQEAERVVPNQASMQTVAVPLDGDATLRVTPAIANQTIRVAAPVAETLRTPLPAGERRFEPAAQTAAEHSPAGSRLPFIAVAAVVVLLLAGAIWLLRPRTERPPILTSATTTTAAPSRPATTSLDVSEPPAAPTTTTAPPTLAATATAPPVTATQAPTPVTAPAKAEAPPVTRREQVASAARQEPPAEETRHEPAPAPKVEEAPTVDAYTENGDEDRNEALVARARQQLQGVSRVALQAGPLWAQRLTNVLKDEIPSLQIVDNADVVIRFEGNLDRLGRGRKARSATATVYKNGRPVFRYEMPREEYRVGADPAEAFVSALSEAFN